MRMERKKKQRARRGAHLNFEDIRGTLIKKIKGAALSEVGALSRKYSTRFLELLISRTNYSHFYIKTHLLEHENPLES